MRKSRPRIIRRQEVAYAISRDCDCACSCEVASQRDEPITATNLNLQVSPDLCTIQLPRDHQAAFIPSGGGAADSIAVLNGSAWELLSTFKEPFNWKTQVPTWQQWWGEQQVDNILTKLIELRFLSDPANESVLSVEQPRTLAAWLHITDRCNLRCAYCYLPHASTDMPIELGLAAVDAVFRSAMNHGYRNVKLKYAGGEPLLRFPIIAELHQHALKLADKLGLALDGVILSNGTLLNPQTLDTMQALCLRLMISLDGIGVFHDSQRPFANGRGSNKHVTHALKIALSRGISPDVSITVSSRSMDGLPYLIAWLLEQDLPFSLNFYRENDLSASETGLQLQDNHVTEAMLAAYKAIEANLPRRCLLASLADRANLSIPHRHTCGVGHNYLVVDCRGGVGKCQMQIGKAVADVTDPDPLLSIQSDEEGIVNLPVDEKSGCRECEWKYWCTGGCPLHTYRATGRYDVKSPNCDIYKALFPEIIRLEGLRLLKYADQVEKPMEN